MMKAIMITKPGTPDVLQMTEIAAPTLQAKHVRVKVKATALNRADLLQRQGLYPPPAGESEILGLEMAGIVTEVAPDVTQFSLGQRVCTIARWRLRTRSRCSRGNASTHSRCSQF